MTPLQQYGQQIAAEYQIPWPIFNAWINEESGWNPTAQSPAGAEGIAQIMPGTAQGWGVNPWDPYAALAAAGEHLSEYYTEFGNSWANALAAYNAGPGAVQKYGGIPPYSETQNYVHTILGNAGETISNIVQQFNTSDTGGYGSIQVADWSSVTKWLVITVGVIIIGIFGWSGLKNAT